MRALFALPLLLASLAACDGASTEDTGLPSNEDSGTEGVDPEQDADGDGTPADADCNDTNASIHPGAPELCDGIDNDCDTVVDPPESTDATVWFLDADADGYGVESSEVRGCTAPSVDHITTSGDCNDADADVNPSADERCDDIDNNCDGETDDPSAIDPLTLYVDADLDGIGDSDLPVAQCALENGLATEGGDCDDANPLVFPDADEVCDGIDNDCDEDVDPPESSDAKDWFEDSDADGFGDATTAVRACEAPDSAQTDVGGDCNDSNADVHPDADERCDDIDNNCDGETDDPSAIDTLTVYSDGDGDGLGDPNQPLSRCTVETGTSASAGDCDDTDAATGAAVTWYADADADGLGNEDVSVESCADPSTDSLSYTRTATDCDDSSASIGEPTPWYEDADADGFGSDSASLASCDDPSTNDLTYVDVADDCNDADADVNPSADERCDDIDNNCDDLTDDSTAIDASTFYADADNDGYGSGEDTTLACSEPTGFTTDSSDCNDDNRDVYPGVDEICDTLDNDCDGKVDYADPDADVFMWYLDEDGDGHGDASEDRESCEKPTGYVRNDNDCDDSNPDVNPDAEETCDAGLDNDCNGLADKDDPEWSGRDGTWYRDGDGDGFGDAEVNAATCIEPTGYVRNDDDCDDVDPSVWTDCP